MVVSNATALMQDLACDDNYAEVQGGAIVTFNGGTAEVCGGDVSDNFARVTGGALAINVRALCLGEMLSAATSATMSVCALVRRS